ncbi:cytochrome c oxidase assembly protein [Salsipaludibacter albus]|uniref:cytochrome c oxidase assembly protein n=1 Tax=Salsipaludibacter albus TaxID=2849650 RepID=UPI001EE3C254|nr:cytochrome c oxidase assembly protein [Salsipaludibacter albus]MBY5161801.1 cytochrome c oxidase assembly protein [Salsipaludibacter albus]
MDFTLGGVDVQAGFPLDVTLLSIGVLAAWWGLIRRHGPTMTRPGQPAVTGRQAAFFVAGVATFWLSDGWPLAALSEHLFSFHMLQHVLQAFVIPPLLLLGLPEWMGDVLLRNDRVRAAVRWLTRPLVAGVLFNLVFLVTHLPAVVAFQLDSEVFHAADHLVLIGSALLMWTPVFSPFPAVLPRMQPLSQMLYLFMMTLLPTIPSAFLLFGDVPLYPVYNAVSQPWDIGLITDMRIGGLIMKLGGGFLLWGIIAVKFFRWAADDERRDRQARIDRMTLSTTQSRGPA